jgi:hypothetical protein
MTVQPANEGQPRQSIIGDLGGQGVVNLDASLRTLVEQVARAPGVDGQLLITTLARLHDEGVVNLDSSLRKVVDAVALDQLASMRTDIICNDNLALVVRPPTAESKSPGLER